MRPIRLSEYFKRYSAINSKPKLIHFISILPSVFKQGPIAISYFLRFVRANQIPNLDDTLNLQNPPEIVIAVIATQKDFYLLKFCIEFGVRNSINPVEKICIITPATFTEECTILTRGFQITLPIEVISEETLISNEDRNKVKLRFKTNYGWILQQVLKLSFVMKQESAGVLIIDADTVILKPTLWVDRNSRQILLVSSEFHKPYYIFLQKIGLISKNPRYTFVTHHMLFQPKILKTILNRVSIKSISNLINLVVTLSDKNNSLPVCIEYEIYGQGILKFYSELTILSRFCNLPIRHESNQLDNVSIARDYSVIYKSISLHSYLH